MPVGNHQATDSKNNKFTIIVLESADAYSVLFWEEIILYITLVHKSKQEPLKHFSSPCTLLFYQIEPLKNGPSPVLPSSLSRDS